MNDREIRIAQMASRLNNFGTTHAADFSATSLGGQLFANLGQEVALLEQLGSNQATGSGAAQAGTGEKRVVREAIRKQMRAISNTADAIEKEFPGFSSNFRLPQNNGDQALINSARAFIAAATPLKQEFIKREMPASFLEDLAASVERLESAVNNSNSGKGKRVASTAAIKASLERVMDLKRQLDPIVRNKYRSDAATLAAWTSASHIERAPTSSKRETPTPATP